MTKLPQINLALKYKYYRAHLKNVNIYKGLEHFKLGKYELVEDISVIVEKITKIKKHIVLVDSDGNYILLESDENIASIYSGAN